MIMDWLDELISTGYYPPRTIPVQAFGLANSQAKMLLWRRESIPFHTRYLQDELLVENLATALELVETVGSILTGAAWKYASLVVLKHEDTRPTRDEKAAIDKLVYSLAVEPSFWARVDAPFGRLVGRLATCTTGGNGEASYSDALNDWKDDLKRTAKEIFESSVGQDDTTGQSLRAMSVAQGLFHYRLRTCLNETSE